MGILSLENFTPGTRVVTNFFLPGMTEKISSKALVVNSNQKICNLYYHSVRFDNINKADQEAIMDFVHENKQLLKNPA
jgi:c-di-GMP-binding flagellar brake protein YcgR